jgi:hypothetical protein
MADWPRLRKLQIGALGFREPRQRTIGESNRAQALLTASGGWEFTIDLESGHSRGSNGCGESCDITDEFPARSGRWRRWTIF